MKTNSRPPPYAHPDRHRRSNLVVTYSCAHEGAELAEGLLMEARGSSDGRAPGLAHLAHRTAGRMLAALDAAVDVPDRYWPQTDELRARLRDCYERAETLRR
jgi:hypothetical protein